MSCQTHPTPPEHAGTVAYGELFGVAEAVMEWLRELRPYDRPVGIFNRLQDAIDGVREAHQMGGFEFQKPTLTAQDMQRLSLMFGRSSDLRTDQDRRINDWLKTRLEETRS